MFVQIKKKHNFNELDTFTANLNLQAACLTATYASLLDHLYKHSTDSLLKENLSKCSEIGKGICVVGKGHNTEALQATLQVCYNKTN